MLNADQLARVSDFIAVPGCGLKCNVSQVETLLNGSVSDDQIMNTRNSSASLRVTYDIHDELDVQPVIQGQLYDDHVSVNLLTIIITIITLLLAIVQRVFHFHSLHLVLDGRHSL